MIRAKFPCVAVALAWTPAPDTVAIYRIYQSWTGEGPDAKCAPMGELVYTTDVGVRGTRFVLPGANLGGGGRCLYIEAANRAGASAWVRFDDDFTTP
jgi:hypothetical protein